MARPSIKRRAPEPSGTRTNRDLVMIVLGVCLTIFFLVVGVMSLGGPTTDAPPRSRGPVKNPPKSELRIPDAPPGNEATKLASTGGQGPKMACLPSPNALNSVQL